MRKTIAIMKKNLTTILLFIATHSFCQTDHNGNPVFNSVTTNEETIADFKFISNYYTLKNNIENKTSSVYISENPTLDEIVKAATTLPSDFFLLVKGQSIINMVMITNYPTRKIVVLNPETGKQNEFKCSIKGDITENRASEIIKEKYDSNSTIQNNKLFFNNKKLRIITNEKIKQTVLDLIAKEKLSNSDPSNMKILSKEELRTLILKETKEGGKLDFFTPIKGKEYDGVQIKPGLISTNLGVALYKWGRSNFDLGVNTLEDALSIFAEFKGRQLNQREKEYIKLGFEKGLEK
jgi:hypothetical protein